MNLIANNNYKKLYKNKNEYKIIYKNNKMDDPEFCLTYFVDYFGNINKYGTIGVYRQYDINDVYGMNKANAMDIADIECELYKNISFHVTFNNWFQDIKYSAFYNAVHIYLFNIYLNTSYEVEHWFLSFYNMHI
jgi:hypothetical protein